MLIGQKRKGNRNRKRKKKKKEKRKKKKENEKVAIMSECNHVIISRPGLTSGEIGSLGFTTRVGDMPRMQQRSMKPEI